MGVNSTLQQRCRSNPRFPGSARKRVGAWVWSKAGGQGAGEQGPRGMGRDRGALEARRFPVRVCQCRGAAPPPSSLDREAGPRGGCTVLSFPAGRTPPLLTACLLLVLTPTFNSCKSVQLPAWSRAGSSAEEIPIYSHFPNVPYLSTRCANRQERERERESKGRGRRQQGKDRAGRAKEEGLLRTALASLLSVVRVSE